MKLLKKHKEILNELIKGKGYWKNVTTLFKDYKDKTSVIDLCCSIVQRLISTFQRQYDVTYNLIKITNTWLDLNGMML